MELISRSTPYFHKAATFKRNPSKRFLSCELEVYKCDGNEGAIHDTVARWKGAIVEDSSIGSDEGFEICTAPANGDLFLDQIKEICTALEVGGAEVRATCGYHVHVSAKDMDYWDLRKLILLYSKIESTLFRMIPASRRTSDYCLPCAQDYLHGLLKDKDAKNRIISNTYRIESVDGKDRRDHLLHARRCKYMSVRYNALNLHSWFFRGTVECRLAAGTVKYTKVVNWAMLWAAILDFAYANSEAKIKELPQDSKECLLAVCPPDLRAWVLSRHSKFSS
jgi:hypothetical protein